jgi:cytochrome c-type biogenesis protein CcsB
MRIAGWSAMGVAVRLGWLGLLTLTASITARGLAAGRPPYANQYEFAIAFAWGTLAIYLLLRRTSTTLLPAVLTLVLGLLLYAGMLPSEITPPVPALQNRLILALHVGCAVVAYGANGVAFTAACLFLIQLAIQRHTGETSRRLPDLSALDALGYRAVMLGFPMLGAVLLLGSWWSWVAWGSYWSWDPKQSATLATWLLYGAYLHSRTVRERQGLLSALLLIAGFGSTLLTYLGNLFFGGLHSYSGL